MKEIISNLKKLSLVQICGVGSVLIALVVFLLFEEPKKEEPPPTKVSVSEKGFELFDDNTWFKGEKELQVLEIRALKGQLEKDLLKFEKIESATVILDIAPARSLQKTKASVILLLKEDQFLTHSDIEAISLHVASGVKGLESKNVVLSDTSGRLYQGCDNGALIESEEMNGAIGTLLKASVGKEHFVKLTNSFVIDSTVASTALRQELAQTFPKVTFKYLPFRKKEVQAITSKPNFTWLFLIPGALLVFATAFFFLRKEKRGEKEDLTESLKKQSPEMIAELLSYTKPERAQEIILKLPEEMQEKVFESISRLEKTL